VTQAGEAGDKEPAHHCPEQDPEGGDTAVCEATSAAAVKVGLANHKAVISVRLDHRVSPDYGAEWHCVGETTGAARRLRGRSRSVLCLIDSSHPGFSLPYAGEMPTQEAPEAASDSIAAIGRQVAEDAAQLVRDEVALAKAELGRAAKKMAVSAALFAVTGVCLILMAMAGLGALADGLGTAIFGHAWIGWLVLVGVFLLLALVIGLLGYRSVRKTIGGGKRTVSNIKEDVEWLKQLTKLNNKET
jgi:uncharacterized membrane protein YqjE